jgi:hypothetical protein
MHFLLVHVLSVIASMNARQDESGGALAEKEHERLGLVILSQMEKLGKLVVRRQGVAVLVITMHMRREDTFALKL